MFPAPRRTGKTGDVRQAIMTAKLRGIIVFSICFALEIPGIQASPLNSGRQTLTDSLQRTVVLPPRSERILSLQPEMTRIIVALGGRDRLVGVDYFVKEHDRLFSIIFPRASQLPAVSNTPEDMNFEMVMRLDPDVVFVSPTERQMVDVLQKKMQKPVIALSSMGKFENLLREIDLAGKVLGREERAAELIAYFDSKVGSIRGERSRAIPARKPRVYLAFWASLTRTPVFYEPVNAAGGVNCAENLLPAYLGTLGTVIQVEQIIIWNPDIILVHGNYSPGERSVTVESVLGDRRLASVSAVRNRRVYYTFGFWYWWDPAQVLVETLYLARIFSPETAGRVDIEAEGNAIYEKFYGIQNGFTSVCRIIGCGTWHEQ